MRQASMIAAQRQLSSLTSHEHFSRLENGHIKHPSRELLEAVAQLYKVDYRELVSQVASITYGIDLSYVTAHVTPTTSNRSNEAPGDPIPTYTATDIQAALLDISVAVARLHSSLGIPATTTDNARVERDR